MSLLFTIHHKKNFLNSLESKKNNLKARRNGDQRNSEYMVNLSTLIGKTMRIMSEFNNFLKGKIGLMSWTTITCILEVVVIRDKVF